MSQGRAIGSPDRSRGEVGLPTIRLGRATLAHERRLRCRIAISTERPRLIAVAMRIVERGERR
jgi:hypothetical protein